LVEVPNEVGNGKAQVRLSFDAWKDGKVSPRTVEVVTEIPEVKSSPQLRATWNANTEGVTEVRFSPDGKTLVSVGPWGEVKLWDVQSGKQRLTLPSEGEVFGVVFTPDGKRLLVPSYQPADAAGKPLARPYNSRDIKGFRGGVRLIDPDSGKLVGWLRRDPRRGVLRVSLSADGKTVAMQEYRCGEKNAQLLRSTSVWDLATGKPIAELPGKDVLFGISADGKTLARRGDTEGVLWDISSASARASLTSKGEFLTQCHFGRDGKTLAGMLLGPDGERIGLWDAASGKRLKLLSAPVAVGIVSLALSPDGGRVAGGQRARTRAGGPCTVLVWDVKTGKQVLMLNGHTHGVQALDFHPGGKVLASGGSDGTIRLWDVP
jgi:WD40 repeat protein